MSGTAASIWISQTSDDSEDAPGIWLGIMRGRWSVVESFELDERRVLIVQRSQRESRNPDTLSELESRVLARAAEGHPDKRIANQLGVAEGTVSACLCHGMSKLKIPGRMELVRQLGFRGPSDHGDTKKNGVEAGTIPEPAGTRTVHRSANVAILEFPIACMRLPTQLTTAEQEVARLVFEGASNGQMARARGASIKTIGNQLGAIFRKLDVSSRFELVLYLRRESAEPNESL